MNICAQVNGKMTFLALVEKRIKVIGVWTSLEITWDRHFEIMRKKIEDSINKLVNKKVTVGVSEIHTNTRILKSTNFNFSMVKITSKKYLE